MNDWQPDVTFEDGVFRFDLPNGDEFVIVPLKPRELSDEEIKAIANNLTCTPDKNWNVLFARAILKKASEK